MKGDILSAIMKNKKILGGCMAEVKNDKQKNEVLLNRRGFIGASTAGFASLTGMGVSAAMLPIGVAEAEGSRLTENKLDQKKPNDNQFKNVQEYLGAPLFSPERQVIAVQNDGGNFSTIQEAIDAITDSSEEKPYVVLVAPGRYFPWDFSGKDYIHVKSLGYGVIVDCKAGATSESRVLLSGSHNAISGISFKFIDGGSGAGHHQYCIYTAAPYDNFILEDCSFDIEHSDASRTTTSIWAYGKVGATAGSGQPGFGDIIRNCTVFTDSSGFALTSNMTTDLYNNTIILTTRNNTAYISGYDHIGVNVAGSGRVFWYSGKITTGYGSNNVYDDSGNIYGFNVSALSSNSRLNVHSCNGILRNDSVSANGENVYVNITPTVSPAFECRLYGSFRGQCEKGPSSTTNNIIKTGYVPWDSTANPGKVLWLSEGFSGTYSGNVAGAQYQLNIDANGWSTQDRETKIGGHWYADTSMGTFQINLIAIAGKMITPLTIYNTDFGGSNNLVVGQGSGDPLFDIDGIESGRRNVIIEPGTSKTFTARMNGSYWVS